MPNTKVLLKAVSLILTVAMVIFVASPVFAATNDKNGNMALERIKRLSATGQKILKRAIERPQFTNISELSTSDKEMVAKIAKNPELYLAEATLWEDQVILIYDTPNRDVKIASTDGYVEVIERKDENTFLINGQEHYFRVTKSEIITLDEIYPCGIYPADDPGCSWSFLESFWIDVRSQNLFNTYTIGALAAIISAFLNPYAAIAVGIATMLITSIFSDTNVAEIFRSRWVGHVDNPPYYQTFFKISDTCYALWNGERKYLGYENSFYIVY